MAEFICPFCGNIHDVQNLIYHRSCDYCSRDLTAAIQNHFRELYQPPSDAVERLLVLTTSHLRAGSWDMALGYANSIIGLAPKFHLAYLYIFMARQHVYSLSQLKDASPKVLYDPDFLLFLESADPVAGAFIECYLKSILSSGEEYYSDPEYEDEEYYSDPEYEDDETYSSSTAGRYYNTEPGKGFIDFFRFSLFLIPIILIMIFVSSAFS